MFGPTMPRMIHRLLAVSILLATLPACDYQTARDRYDHQIELCQKAIRNGLVDMAADACNAALAIANEETYPAAERTEVLFQTASLERQRREFEKAESLARESLQIEQDAGNDAGVASRLVELSFSVAGQGRVEESAQLLIQAAPLADALEGDQREQAANAFRGIGMRLQRQGQDEQARMLIDTAAALAAQ